MSEARIESQSKRERERERGGGARREREISRLFFLFSYLLALRSLPNGPAAPGRALPAAAAAETDVYTGNIWRLSSRQMENFRESFNLQH